jgi:predicted dehydrogenase
MRIEPSSIEMTSPGCWAQYRCRGPKVHHSATAFAGGVAMAGKIKVGVVGATVTTGGSGWGANAHVPALKALPDFELVAVCTAHEDTARASAEAFGAPLAFHDIDDMVAHPDVDLVAVVVRVPLHHGLVMAALRGGKQVFCEWPLGADLAQAEEMSAFAREHSLATVVGLQGRSDPAVMYARDLIRQGYVGEVLTANLSIMTQAQIERGPGRIWQGVRANGANTLTIAGGHGIDAMCHILGEFTEVTARVQTRIKEWRHADTGAPFAVDSPDSIAFAGRLESGAEAAVQVSAVPFNPSGTRLEVYGREGALVLSAGSFNIGPVRLFGALGREKPAEMEPPDEYRLVPEGTPAGAPRNVAQAYVRFADALDEGRTFDPDFDAAVVRHRLIDALERSSREGRAVVMK